jgi:predicted Zn-dependent peptidase
MEVREKRGLAYYVRCGPGQYIDTGAFVISAGVQVDKIEEALSVITTELSRLKNEPVGDEELLKAKNYLKGRAVLGLEDNQSRLDWFLDQIAFKEKVNTPQEAFKLVDQVTAADVVRVAKEILQTAKLSFAVIGPYSNPKRFAKFLKIN